MQTENIVKFLQTAYSDEKLAALLAHAQDGKLGYSSCCCLIAIPSAPHALQECDGIDNIKARGVDVRHYTLMDRHMGTLAWCAENEFYYLSENGDDTERSARLIPLILAEQERREKLRTLSPVTLEESEEMEVAR